MTLHPTWLRSRLVATSRNTFLGETHDSRTYETRFGLRCTVRTICEMERVDSFERVFKIGETLTVNRPERFALSDEELKRNERFRKAHYDERSGA